MKPERIDLTPTGLLMEGVYTQNACWRTALQHALSTFRDLLLETAALTFVREVKQQDWPLRLNQELAADIIRTADPSDGAKQYSSLPVCRHFPVARVG